MVMAEIPIIRVGNYDIFRTIGKGNFASVKLARHRVTKTEVAIKIIEKFRLDQSDLKKIYREIQILKLLRHPHIMKLYEVIETKTKIYLVCEYASNGEVFDYITREERIPEEEARKMFYQVLTAIEYCHKHNVVHRDLKAENLLLDSNHNIKLADFGFGNFFQSGQNLNTWCGSPPYAAPEVFEGKLYEGPQLDIWSLGIVLYVLVCGTFPFDGSNLASLKERVLAGRFRIPYWMSQDCENLIRRMLVVNPKKRLTIAQIKKHKWIEPVTNKTEPHFRNCDSPSRRPGSNQLPEFNEHVLKMMQGLGMDRNKALESLRNSAYDYQYAIYHLLVDRLKCHRTSVPIETKFTYDGGKRRPSNIAEQSMAKHALASSSSSSSKPPDLFRPAIKNVFFNSKPLPWPSVAGEPGQSQPDDYLPSDVIAQRRDVQFIEETGSDMPAMQRTLKLGTLPVPHLPQSPMSPPAGSSKPKYITQPCRGHLPHQPWSFNSGLGIRAYHKSPHSLVTGLHHNGSGDVIPSVTSIDEGVELRSVSPSEQEMMQLAASQQRRHTLGIPESTAAFSHLVSNSSELSFLATAARDENQSDSLFGSSGVGTYDSGTLNDSLEMSCDSAPKVVLSPCLDESNQSAVTQESHVTYVENQRQLLDVSPTGFREGRRASDGLLLGDSRIGEHLKRLSRANHFPPIQQEENDDNCFEASQRDQEINRLAFLHVNPEMKATNELGAMTSHSSQHVMQQTETINFQPYASPNRRRSLQVAQLLAEERCSSYSKGFETPSVRQHTVANPPPQALQHTTQSYDQPDDDHLYQWSSWKTVTENELPNSETLQQRRDTIPLMGRTNMGTFAASSDESMAKYSSSENGMRRSPVHGIDYSGGQSLVQALQRRRINRRRNIAQNTQHQTHLPEFELLRIVDNLNTASLNNPGSTEELTSRLNNRHQSPTRSFDGYRGNSPELHQNFSAGNRNTIGQFVTMNHDPSSLTFTTYPNAAALSGFVDPYRTSSSPPTFYFNSTMENSS